ncbi:MAG: radical SAM protein, partial [Desulfobulbus sp.]|nr:radical SAM protein [Desulfobulbus sp.]
MRSILLIHPPVAKPGEPPAGIAALAGCLRAHDVGCTLLDANLEALLFLIGQADACQDTRSERALRHRDVNLAALRTSDTYRHPGRYQKAVHELNHALQLTARSHPGMALSLTNCQDEHNNPLVSADLLSTAENFRNSLFFPWFNSRLPPLLDTVRPAYIGISLCYLSQALPTFALLGFLKDRYPEAQLILGGGLITS